MKLGQLSLKFVIKFVTAVPGMDIGTALTSQLCHMPYIGTPASFELVGYHAIMNK